MKIVAILDPSVGTENLGDAIIYDAVREEIDRLFADPLVIRVSTHEYMWQESRRLLNKASHVFLGGSNLLQPRMEWNTQWKLSPFDLLHRIDAICLGCGWKYYGRNPTRYTKALYARALSGRYLHSVRDAMTQAQLQKAGVANAINTGCVTMWGLSPDHCAGIARHKAATVITSVTAYNADPDNDRFMMQTLFAQYDQVWLLVQQPEDLAYAQALAPGSFGRVVQSLRRFDELLAAPCDYVGTRLHGGIRALQKQRRSLIVGIDNRAIEIARDTNLPTIHRKDLAGTLADTIAATRPIEVQLPTDAIGRWRGQFAAI